ncbi:hypothetical protein GCM10009740_14470 [Terrabacter terrae]|uniref:Uncharacterized protein n=1 Tax=Terrabacter terrae TaxID=318434 RepID=A0ABN2U0N8_9MICO
MSTQEAVRHVEGEVRELIRRSGLDPSSDTKAVRRLVQDAVQDYDQRSLHGGLPSLGDQRLAVHSILSVVAGYGPLQQYFDDPAVEEIWINKHDRGLGLSWRELLLRTGLDCGGFGRTGLDHRGSCASLCADPEYPCQGPVRSWRRRRQERTLTATKRVIVMAGG